MPSANRPKYLKGTASLVASTRTVVPLTRENSDLKVSKHFPQMGKFGTCRMLFTNAAGLTTMDWYLATDSAGDKALTPDFTSEPIAGGTANAFSVPALIESDFVVPSSEHSNTVYLVITADADADLEVQLGVKA